MKDMIYRDDAIEAVCDSVCGIDKCECESFREKEFCLSIKAITSLPSAEAQPSMTEGVREALMRLTMCAREECGMCKYKDECSFDFQYNISTENMHTILDALSGEAVQGWISCSERLPSEEGHYLCCNKGYLPYVGNFRNGRWSDFDCTIVHADAWMPLPEPYKGGGSE